MTISSSDDQSDTKSDHKQYKRPTKNTKGYISIDMGENSMDQETYAKNTPKVQNDPLSTRNYNVSFLDIGAKEILVGDKGRNVNFLNGSEKTTSFYDEINSGHTTPVVETRKATFIPLSTYLSKNTEISLTTPLYRSVSSTVANSKLSKYLNKTP